MKNERSKPFSMAKANAFFSRYPQKPDFKTAMPNRSWPMNKLCAADLDEGNTILGQVRRSAKVDEKKSDSFLLYDKKCYGILNLRQDKERLDRALLVLKLPRFFPQCIGESKARQFQN